MFRRINSFDNVGMTPSSLSFVQGKASFVIRDDKDLIRVFDLMQNEIVAEKRFNKIDYLAWLEYAWIVSDVGNQALMLLSNDTLEIMDSVAGKYYCGGDAESGHCLFCAVKSGSVRRVVQVSAVDRRLIEIQIPLKKIPILATDQFFFDFHGSIFLCGSLKTGEIIWSIDVSAIIPNSQIANRGYWLINNMVVVRTANYANDSMGYPELLLWLDIYSGEVIHRRDDGVHLMQRIEDDIYILTNPFEEEGRLLIISLHDAKTKLDLPVYNVFLPFAYLNKRGDNFQYVKQESTLYILHFYNKAITVFDLDKLQISEHFLVQSATPFLRNLEVHDRWLFVLDAKDTLHIYERETTV